MANQGQLEILKHGTEVWNKWRKDNPDVNIDLWGATLQQLDLSRVDLSKASMREADLSKAKLSGANFTLADLGLTDLSETQLAKANFLQANLMRTCFILANLTEANLLRAELGEADLGGANLNGANLRRANLQEADLTDANLMGANLYDTNFVEANLTHTDFTDSHLQGTIFADTDLSDTRGLERIKHRGPSKIDITTIRRSKGKIPIEFLRGCGLSNLEIECAKLAAPGLDPEQVAQITCEIYRLHSDQPIQFYSCFISYSSKDQEFAQRLHDDLQNDGVRCWFAPEDMKGGKKIYQQITTAIQTHDRLLLILSESSMASEWVRTELANARQREVKESRQVLFPISLVSYERIKEWSCFDGDIGKDSAREIREYFIPDFSNWQDEQAYKASFERLLGDLKA